MCQVLIYKEWKRYSLPGLEPSLDMPATGDRSTEYFFVMGNSSERGACVTTCWKGKNTLYVHIKPQSTVHVPVHVLVHACTNVHVHLHVDTFSPANKASIIDWSVYVNSTLHVSASSKKIEGN